MLPPVVELNEMVPVGATVALCPVTTATNVVLAPAGTGLGEACNVNTGLANLTDSVVLEDVEG